MRKCIGCITAAAIIVLAIPAGARDRSVLIFEDHLDPVATSVSLGDTVTWINARDVPRRVHQRDLDLFRSPLLLGGEDYGHKFMVAGTFRYRAELADADVDGGIASLAGEVEVLPEAGGIRGFTRPKILAIWARPSLRPPDLRFDVQRGVEVGGDGAGAEVGYRWRSVFRRTERFRGYVPYRCDGRFYGFRVRVVDTVSGAKSGWAEYEYFTACFPDGG